MAPDGTQTLWIVFQTIVMIVVMSANIYWQLTPNPILAGLIAFGVAMAATSSLNYCIDLWRKLRRHRKGEWRRRRLSGQ